MTTAGDPSSPIIRCSSVCSCINLRRASSAVTGIYDGFLSSSGLNISQFSLLKHIYSLGPASVSDLALEMRLDRTTIVRNLKALEQIGYVEDISAQGSRNRLLILSESGKVKYIAAGNQWEQAQSFLQEALGDEDMKVLTTLLSKVEKLMA
ncbi:MarR family transcriptional regulator [Paenibacillus sp. LMG 31459]|uniref:MarR family transcriptional regulator n=1 Tax=Paenibacillus phytohabitans TaxID=2654978 RepID=A0ABX1YM28_9BACL|nr:MarR family winged helix-turn-helix transcriptional regulator [Paenibacillus phytohabitans]NOU82107.1 MarR family transcriptional regulator [Paenibacillus phytohabitans]